MIANLIDNAVCHNNPGGGIEIRTIPQAESAVVKIAKHDRPRPQRHDPRWPQPMAPGQTAGSAA
jgi:hypothetical protein